MHEHILGKLDLNENINHSYFFLLYCVNHIFSSPAPDLKNFISVLIHNFVYYLANCKQLGKKSSRMVYSSERLCLFSPLCIQSLFWLDSIGSLLYYIFVIFFSLSCWSKIFAPLQANTIPSNTIRAAVRNSSVHSGRCAWHVFFYLFICIVETRKTA